MIKRVNPGDYVKITTNDLSRVKKGAVAQVVARISFGRDDCEYAIAIPQEFLNGGEPRRITSERIRDWIDDRSIYVIDNIQQFLDRPFTWVTENEFEPTRVGPDGCSCRACQLFSPMSEPNNSDGSFTCWTCRNNPIRVFY